ncbi:MAG: hypothetical protein II938_01825 [Alphaproteobacteria bacterium]|nr:hypothetical protein [Alphaproteobacteria bacterium]
MEESSTASWHFTRLLMVMCWLLWIVTFFITVTLFQAVLQIRVVAQVVQNVERGFIWFNQDLVQISPLTIVRNDRLDEMLVRYYLDMRYSVIPDRDEMERRWASGGIISYLSSSSVYDDFKPSEGTYEKMENAMPKVVDILNVERRGVYYSVDFDIYTFDGFANWIKNPKRVVVQFAHMPSRAGLGRNLSNPYGFTVTRIDESDRKSVQR